VTDPAKTATGPGSTGAEPTTSGPGPRIALVTGANKGLGAETARRLGRLGLTVIVGARDPQRGQAAAAELRADGADVRVVALDVTDQQTLDDAARLLEAEFGRLDVLINNAGVSLEQGRPAPSELDVGLLRQIFETNVFGVVAVTNTFLPLLRRSAAGRIVNVSSALGSLTAWSDPASPMRRYAPLLLGYNSSKTALNAVTLHYAAELARTPIKVNAASPGYVATDLNEHRGTLKLADEGSVAAIVRLATLPDDGPTGAFLSEDGPVPW
jgi:NAD(P)-dependent dehydrogenase (short-subunit alcohol dehydrogenase family)